MHTTASVGDTEIYLEILDPHRWYNVGQFEPQSYDRGNGVICGVPAYKFYLASVPKVLVWIVYFSNLYSIFHLNKHFSNVYTDIDINILTWEIMQQWLLSTIFTSHHKENQEIVPTIFLLHLSIANEFQYNLCYLYDWLLIVHPSLNIYENERIIRTKKFLDIY